MMGIDLPEVRNADEPEKTRLTYRGKPRVNLGIPSLFLGLFGLALNYLGTGWVLGYTNILYYAGGMIMSLAVVLAILAIKGERKAERIVAIFTLALTSLTLLSFWSSLPSLLSG